MTGHPHKLMPRRSLSKKVRRLAERAQQSIYGTPGRCSHLWFKVRNSNTEHLCGIP